MKKLETWILVVDQEKRMEFGLKKPVECSLRMASRKNIFMIINYDDINDFKIVKID